MHKIYKIPGEEAYIDLSRVVLVGPVAEKEDILWFNIMLDARNVSVCYQYGLVNGKIACYSDRCPVWKRLKPVKE